MAPSDPAKGLQVNRQRPSARVVPAIPLPYLQKRRQNVPAPKKSEDEPASNAVVTPNSSSPPATDQSPVVTNGFSDADADAEADVGKAMEEASAPATPAISAEEENVEVTNEVDEVAVPASADNARESTPVDLSENPTSESRSTYSMPPPFIPANNNYQASTGAAAAVEPVKFLRQLSFGAQHSMHQNHPSASSLVFGGYPDSNNSSPAPPLSAGGIHQYPTQGHPDGAGRVQVGPYPNGGHMPGFSNGFAAMGPQGSAGYYPRQENYLNQNAGSDNVARRGQVSFVSNDTYSPVVTPSGGDIQRFLPPYDPVTPRSFHGSQSSAPNDQDNNGPTFHGQYSTAVISNSSNGNVEDVRLYHQPRPKGRNSSQNVTGGQSNYPQPGLVQAPMPPAMDHLDGLVGYIQSQFADPQFADYTLELRYADDRATPVRIPGHNLVFARSPTLKTLMTAQARESTGDSLTLRTLLIESDDRFLRSDGFWLAVQRLYGGPLLDPGASAISSLTAALSSSTPGTPADRFDLALGYAAAGNVLQMPPVVNRGLDIASHFVNWLTLEKALDFALDGGLDSQWTMETGQHASTPSTYGPAVNMLIHSALNFIVTTFPPNFDLDITATEPSHNRRLPLVIEGRPSMSNPRLSSIKFGDHLSQDVTRPSNNSTAATLSRILLNLPFQLLKYVLESPRLGNVHGWATATLRQKVMHAVIEEREKRRNRARDGLSVSNAERTADGNQWEAVGWQESVAPPHNGNDSSTLTRTWINYLIPSSN